MCARTRAGVYGIHALAVCGATNFGIDPVPSKCRASITKTVSLIRALYVHSSEREKHLLQRPKMTPDSTSCLPPAVTALA